MKYECENNIKGKDGSKYFIGDKVSIYQKGTSCIAGKITQITSRGIYLNAGGKSDKYFRADQIDEIELLKKKGKNQGIKLSDKYILDTLDELNVIVKEKYMSKAAEGGKPEAKFKTISYHPNLELAFKSIVDREINIAAGDGIKAVIQKVLELKEFKKTIFR